MYDILQITVVAVDYKMSLKNYTGKEPEYRDIISQVSVFSAVLLGVHLHLRLNYSCTLTYR